MPMRLKRSGGPAGVPERPRGKGIVINCGGVTTLEWNGPSSHLWSQLRTGDFNDGFQHTREKGINRNHTQEP